MTANSDSLSAAGIANAVATRKRSAQDAIDAALARIKRHDQVLNCFTDVTADRARAKARAIDAAIAAGNGAGPLAGVPFAVKNLFDVRGLATRAGSKINRDLMPAKRDAALIERMEAAGAVLVGALNMGEYAYDFTGENVHDGASRNPHDPSRMTGGSSGGSGSAVAGGLVPVALGSDTNGSIRVPASLCGVFGLKPTFGRLPRRGTFPFVASIDHLGPFARSVEDLAAAYDALQGPDPLDPGCHATRVQPASAQIHASLRGLRIGTLGGYFEENAGPVARRALEIAANALHAAPGVEWPDAALGRIAAFVITASEGGSLHLPLLRERAAEFEPLSVDRFIAGALQPVEWYVRAQRFRARYRAGVQALFEQWDVLLAPATPVQAPL